jgi:HTH-type transcriptional regulator, glycine betaine synthesis regulator
MPRQLLSPDKTVGSETVVPLSEFEIEAIDLFIHSVQILGLPRSIGEIYGYLFAQAQPQPMDMIIRRLNISVGSASQGLKFLKSVGAVRVTLQAGDRREFFTAQTELRKLAMGLIKERIQPHLDGGAVRIEQMLQSSRRLPPHERDALTQRVEILKSWRSKTSKVLPFIVRYLAH